MKNRIYMSCIVPFLMLIIYSCNHVVAEKETVQEVKKEVSKDSLISRGKYLVSAIGCRDCHSPKRMGPNGVEIITETDLSGYPADRPMQEIDVNNLKKGWMLFNPDLTTWVGPWGQSFSANITNDLTGIGSWSEENFFTAIRKGKYKGLENSRDLLPPMPWQQYSNLSDDDLRAIFAYLKSTPPVRNVVPEPIQPANSGL